MLYPLPPTQAYGAVVSVHIKLWEVWETGHSAFDSWTSWLTLACWASVLASVVHLPLVPTPSYKEHCLCFINLNPHLNDHSSILNITSCSFLAMNSKVPPLLRTVFISHFSNLFNYWKHFYNTSQHSHIHTKVTSSQRANLLNRNSHIHIHTSVAQPSGAVWGLGYLAQGGAGDQTTDLGW